MFSRFASKELINVFEKISEQIDGFTKYAVMFLIAAMAVLVFLQVVFRYVLDTPLDWSEESASFAFVWMGLLGASVGLRREKHPNLDLLFNALPSKLQKVTRIFINMLAVFMLVVLMISGVRLTFTMRFQMTAALGYPVSFAYAVLPISAFIMLLHVIAQSLKLIMKNKRIERKQQ